MGADPLVVLAGLIAQQMAYLASLAWIAWHFERLRGIDAFHLFLPVVVGITVTWLSVRAGGVVLPVAAAAGMSVAACLDGAVAFPFGLARRAPADGLLVAAVVVTAVAVALFDHLTNHQPLAVGYSRSFDLFVISLLVLVVLSVASTARRDPYIVEVRLGEQGRQIAQGWRKPRTYPTVLFVVSYGASWYAALILPLATTGVTSYRMLRDIVVALVVVRLLGSRSPALLLPIAGVVAAVRITSAYMAVGQWAAVVVEASVIVIALVVGRLNPLSRRWSELRV